jgi:hypothetical protein
MRNGVFWDVTPCGSCKNRSEELGSSFIKVTIIDDLLPSFALSSTGRTLELVLFLVHIFLSP